MLAQIYIKDFTIIENLALEFCNGMSVLTGETGAGKSILIDAINLTLGARADSKVVRPNAQRAEITVVFQLKPDHPALHWLREQQLDNAQECILRRSITAEGRSSAFINGQASPLQQLKDLGSLLLDIHGQHEHHSLLKRDMQRQLLDEFAGHSNICEEVAQHYQAWKNTEAELAHYLQPQQSLAARQELLHYQIQELTQLNLQADEVTALHNEQKQLSHAEEIIEQCQAALQLTAEDDAVNALSLLHQAKTLLANISALDSKIVSASDLIANALIQVQEASIDIKHFLDDIELNPERLQVVEKRLEAIHDLARKHHVEAEQLFDLLLRLQNEIKALENSNEKIKSLTAQIVKIKNDYRIAAEQLSQSRLKASKKLAKAVSATVQTLGMPGAEFSIQFIANDNSDPAPHGAERVEFLIKTNPGQPLHPLNKIVSGGELSRIGLAISVITARTHGFSTLIFDEVDTGIGGGTAEIVGQLLRQLGQNAQVLCVTHLPQVAALAHHHFKVNKITDKKLTRTEVTLLQAKDKVAEVARMLGGVKITEQTLAHAKEILERVDSVPVTL